MTEVKGPANSSESTHLDDAHSPYFPVPVAVLYRKVRH